MAKKGQKGTSEWIAGGIYGGDGAGRPRWRRRVAGKCCTRPHAPARGIQAAGLWRRVAARGEDSGSAPLMKVGDPFTALLMVWSVSENLAGKFLPPEKSPAMGFF